MRAGGKRRQIVEAGRPVFCSWACRSKHLSITLPCARCDTPVTRLRSEVAKLTTGKVFCSQECRDATGTKPKTGRYIACPVCGTSRWIIPALDTPENTRYCSPECSNEAQRASRIEQKCEHCGKVELVPPSKVSKFCSRECTGAARRRPPGYTWFDPEKGYMWEYVEGGGRKLQHRLRFEELLGRPLLPEEEVHHLNGDKLDNRIGDTVEVRHGKLYSGNLELWSTSQPAGQEVPAKVVWAREILALYGYLVPE